MADLGLLARVEERTDCSITSPGVIEAGQADQLLDIVRRAPEDAVSRFKAG